MTGIGKTRLAQEVYRWLTRERDPHTNAYPEGYWPDCFHDAATKDRVNPPLTTGPDRRFRFSGGGSSFATTGPVLTPCTMRFRSWLRTRSRRSSSDRSDRFMATGCGRRSTLGSVCRDWARLLTFPAGSRTATTPTRRTRPSPARSAWCGKGHRVARAFRTRADRPDSQHPQAIPGRETD